MLLGNMQHSDLKLSYNIVLEYSDLIDWQMKEMLTMCNFCVIM
jgi:hypothetical protein